jgi:hypothetical protein
MIIIYCGYGPWWSLDALNCYQATNSGGHRYALYTTAYGRLATRLDKKSEEKGEMKRLHIPYKTIL